MKSEINVTYQRLFCHILIQCTGTADSACTQIFGLYTVVCAYPLELGLIKFTSQIT